jgi:uncharacterized membrane protein YciS (DUF1049 family)
MHKLLNIALFIAFLIVYLDWGHDGAQFIWQMESSIFTRSDHNTLLLVNPFFILAFIGQVLLIISIIRSKPSGRVTLYGILFLSGLVIPLLIMGLLLFKVKMILSTLPFLFLATIFIIKARTTKIAKGGQ